MNVPPTGLTATTAPTDGEMNTLQIRGPQCDPVDQGSGLVTHDESATGGVRVRPRPENVAILGPQSLERRRIGECAASDSLHRPVPGHGPYLAVQRSGAHELATHQQRVLVESHGDDRGRSGAFAIAVDERSWG